MSDAETRAEESIRVDRWLWAARFFKTRSLATAAVEGGKVHLNGSHVRASHTLKSGDQLRIRRGLEEFEVRVLAPSGRRGPAPAAQALYAETEASATRRLAAAEERRTGSAAFTRPLGRPDKKSRRAIIRFTRGGPD